MTTLALVQWRCLSSLSNTPQPNLLSTNYLYFYYVALNVSLQGLHWLKNFISIRGVKMCFTALICLFGSWKGPKWKLEFWRSFCSVLKNRHHYGVSWFRFRPICFIVFSSKLFTKLICFSYVGWWIDFSTFIHFVHVGEFVYVLLRCEKSRSAQVFRSYAFARALALIGTRTFLWSYLSKFRGSPSEHLS